MLINKLFWLAAILVSLTFLLSFRLTQTPMGLTVDEHAFGWNAALLARDGHDENGTFMPLFVNSINKKDWRQPWTQYYMAGFFKVFGPSIFNLRFSSVILIIFSLVLFYILISRLISPKIGLVSVILLATTPVIFMHSHLGLDNIMPIPFTLIWLLMLERYHQFKRPIYLLLAGITLGASFYAYKGMRAMVPVWAILSCLYVIYLNYQPKIKLSRLIKSTIPFIVGIAPFMLIIPYLHRLYPGAIFGGSRPAFDNIYDLFYPYLSHFDLTFLFIKGDDLLFHSTKIHGMYLITTLPLFFIGLYQSLKLKKFWLFILMALITGPILYGFVDSVHRASRILATVPMFIALITLGLSTVLRYLQRLKLTFLLIIFTLVYLANFADFVNYYWFTYPKFTENIFGNLSAEICYKTLASVSKDNNLKPYIHSDIYNGLYDAIYFKSATPLLSGDDVPPPQSVYLTFHDSVPGMKKLPLNLPHFNIFISQ